MGKAYCKYWRVLMCVLLPFVAWAGVVVAVHFARLLGPCILYDLAGLYCPGCGCTRSATALLHGDILGSLRYNITVVLCCVLSGLLYIEYVLKQFKPNIRIMPRSNTFVVVLFVLLMIYYVGRNFIA